MLRTVNSGVGRVPSNSSRDGSNCQGIIRDFADKPVTSRAWGGEGGISWDDGIHAGIRKIIIRSGTAIDSILIEYDNGGQPNWSVRHGGSGGVETDKIQFDYPNEILLSICGYYGPFYPNGPSAIRSLTFYTNLRKYGPYGVEQGTFFESPQPGSRIVGFHGRSGLFLDAIGVYNRLYINCCSGNNKCDASILLPRVVSVVRDIVEAVKVTNPQESFKVSHLKPDLMGPWGGCGGNPWDDGVYSGIRQVVVGFGTTIDNIKFEYVQNGRFVWSARHGGNGGSKTETIKFDHPNEVLTSISGHYGYFGQVLTVRSLTFHTNRKRYGPFGEEKGTYFASPSSGCKILGFLGRNGWYLDAIGVHLVMEHPRDEGNEDVENAWAEFVSRLIHRKTEAGGT